MQEKTAARVDQEDNEDDDFRGQEAQEMLDELIQSKEKNNGKPNGFQIPRISYTFDEHLVVFGNPACYQNYVTLPGYLIFLK